MRVPCKNRIFDQLAEAASNPFIKYRRLFPSCQQEEYYYKNNIRAMGHGRKEPGGEKFYRLLIVDILPVQNS